MKPPISSIVKVYGLILLPTVMSCGYQTSNPPAPTANSNPPAPMDVENPNDTAESEDTGAEEEADTADTAR